MASSRVVHVGTVLTGVIETPGEYRERRPVLSGTGLTSPRLLAFRRRLEDILDSVRPIHPHAYFDRIRSELLQCALKEPALCAVTDDSLAAFVLHAAQTGLQIDGELKPVLDLDRGGWPVVVPVESARGLVRLLTEAGAKKVTTGTVCQGDRFRHRFDDGDRDFLFEPHYKGGARGSAIAYFCVVDLRQGQWKAAVITAQQLTERQRQSATPRHPAWTLYRDRMGECAAVREAAALLPQGALDPRRSGWTRPPEQEPTTPLGVAADPYDPPTPTPTGAPTPIDAEAEARAKRPAHLFTLPGGAGDFEGWGGQKIGQVPDYILKAVRRWIARHETRQARYPGLDAAIDHVLRVRRDAATPTPDAP